MPGAAPERGRDDRLRRPLRRAARQPASSIHGTCPVVAARGVAATAAAAAPHGFRTAAARGTGANSRGPPATLPSHARTSSVLPQALYKAATRSRASNMR